MVSVPRYNDSVIPQVGAGGQRTPEQSPQIDPEAFGAGFGAELSQLGGQVQKYNDVLYERANQARTNDRIDSFQKDVDTRLATFEQLNEREQFDTLGPTLQDINNLRAKYADEAENPRVKELFEDYAARSIRGTHSTLSRQTAEGLRRWEKSSAISYFDNERQRLSTLKDEKDFEEGVGQIIDDTFAKAHQLGLDDPETHERFTRKIVSEAYADRVINMAIADPVEAQEYLRTHRGDMDFDAYSKLEASVESQAAPEIGDRVADRVIQNQSTGDITNVLKHIIQVNEGTTQVKDSNGYQVRMGINKKYHPEVNLDTLTEEQAIEVYKKDYWAPIAGENVPPNMALTALDSSIWAGPSKTIQWLRQAKGDIVVFTNLRQQWANSLVTSNPEKYGKYAKAWTNRIQNGAKAEVQPALRREILATLPEKIDAIRDMGLPAKEEKAAIASLKAKVSEAATVANAAYLEAQDGIVGYVHDNKPATLGQALKDPNFNAWYSQLTNNDKIKVDHLITSVGKVQLTPEMLDQRKQWIGMAQTNVGAFGKINFTDYWGKVPEGMIKEMQNLQLKVAKKQNITIPAVASMMNYKPVKLALEEAKILDNKGQPKNNERWNQFYGDAVLTLQDWVEHNNRKPKPDEYMKILAPLFMRSHTEFLGMQVSKSKVEYKAMKRPQSIMDIPAVEAEQVKNYLISRGYSPNGITNVMVYEAWMAGQ